MKTYEVLVTEMSYGYISVEAKNEEEAKQEAIKGVQDGNAFWGDSEIVIEGIKYYNEKGELC